MYNASELWVLVCGEIWAKINDGDYYIIEITLKQRLLYFFQIFRMTMAATSEICLSINIKHISRTPTYETVIF